MSDKPTGSREAFERWAEDRTFSTATDKDLAWLAWQVAEQQSTDTEALKRVRDVVKEVVDNAYVVNLEDSESDKATIRLYADLKDALAQLNALIGEGRGDGNDFSACM